MIYGDQELKTVAKVVPASEEACTHTEIHMQGISDAGSLAGSKGNRSPWQRGDEWAGKQHEEASGMWKAACGCLGENLQDTCM